VARAGLSFSFPAGPFSFIRSESWLQPPPLGGLHFGLFPSPLRRAPGPSLCFPFFSRPPSRDLDARTPLRASVPSFHDALAVQGRLVSFSFSLTHSSMGASLGHKGPNSIPAPKNTLSHLDSLLQFALSPLLLTGRVFGLC